MPNSFRVRTSLGEDKVIPIKLDQEFDTLEILSLSIFPNDVYTRNCADFGVICGRVFANKGLGIQNARVSVFIPIQPEDEENPIISTLYPYKSFADFNEDGYKYNLLPYVKSYTGHVPVGTFPDRIDALTNPAVVEVYDKYYKFTAKTNDAGDFMIFGVPVGEHEIFMQVDLSDIGEFSLTPQDLIRMGRATESQVNGTTFKFSENYSELPQIITLTKTVQVAPFYGEKDICDYYIVRADFDLTSEAAIEFKPTAVFMGSLISSNNRKKLKKNCKVPGKQGWLCDLVTGPGQIECIRQTIFTDEDGRPVLEEHKLENDGKLIDSNGAWLVELPMNLDYIYTDESGNRRISPDGSVGVPIRGRYRFKIKWQQTTALNEENRRAYFLVPNIKEHGWVQSLSDSDDPALSTSIPDFVPSLDNNTNIINLAPSTTTYYGFESSSNVSSYTVLVDGVERPEYQQLIPMPQLGGSLVQITYSLIDAGSGDGSIRFSRLNVGQFQLQSSYAFSLSWVDYGTDDMIQEAINCEDRFYEFQYNKVYTVSQLIDRYSGGIFPSKTIQIKHITDNKCEGDYYPFPTNDAHYRYDIFFILFSFVISIFKFVFIPLTIMLHVLAFVWLPIAAIIYAIQVIVNFVIRPICEFVNTLGASLNCPGEESFPPFPENPFKNIKLPLFLNTEEGCERCRCNIESIDVNDNEIADALNNFINQFIEGNSSNLANFNSSIDYTPTTTDSVIGVNPSNKTVITTEYNSVDNGRLKTLLVGWNSPYDEGDLFLSYHWKRLPFFTNAKEINPTSVDGGKFFNVFSLDLTLSERFNLFNTKAKYFDNTSTFLTWYPLLAQNTDSAQSLFESEAGDANGAYIVSNVYPANFDSITSDGTNRNIYLNESEYGQDINTVNAPAGATTRPYIYDAVESLSPGNTGWNQVKVSWGIDFSENASTSNTVGPYKSHFDNLLVIVTDSTPFSRGELLTFQNPNESDDANKDVTIGRFTIPTHVTVNYANPDFQLTNSSSPLKSVQYKIRNTSLTSNGTTCFPTDIEYFQVVQIIPYNRFIELTNPAEGIGGNVSNSEYGKVRGDYRFSLPFRFMRSNHGEFKRWGRVNTKYSTFDSDWKDPDFDNSQKVYTRFEQGGDLYSALCYVRTTVQGITEGMGRPSGGATNNVFNLDSWGSLNNKQNLNVVFLQRGVDPNSPKVKMRFDLRRYFGCKNPWNQNFCKKMGIVNGSGAHIEGNGTNISSPSGDPTWLVEGDYRMNIPIQPGGEDVNVGNWITDNPLGLKLPNHNEILSNEPNPSNNWSHIFFESNFFSYDVDDNDFVGTWKTKMPLYYSALDSNTKSFAPQWMNIDTNDTFPSLTSQDSLTMSEVTAGSVYAGTVKNSTINHFGYRIIMEHARNKWDAFNAGGYNGNYNSEFKIPCSLTSINPYLDQIVPTRQNELDLIGDDPCNQEYPFDAAYNGTDSAIPQGLCCQNNNQSYTLNPDYPVSLAGDNGNVTFGGSTILPYVRRYHRLVPNYVSNNVAGYFGSEYVEGGSLFSVRLNVRSRPLRRDLDCSYAAEQCMFSVAYPDPDCNTGDGLVLNQERDMTFVKEDGSPNDLLYGESATKQRGIYVSPVYAAFPNDVPPAPGFTNENWYVNNNHEITMSNKKRIVFRTDRLPSSDFLQTDDNGNAYLLHQNSGFKIYRINDCISQATGGGEVFLDFPTDTNATDLMPNSNYNEVANSLVNCKDAVDLNSYGVNTDGIPFIHEPNPYSRRPASNGPQYLWFSRGTGCYNLVSKIFASLFAGNNSTIAAIPGLEPEKKYSDIRSVVEWTQRLKLTFAQCFDIFSHTFSNNWINGTLYAFSFQNATIFNDNNQPNREYCKNTIYFHDPLNTYYYRSSPWNGTNFIGKAKYDLTVSNPNNAADRYGNTKNLLFPTTILDMGPKNRFIQEIVFSDEYDGYIADVVPTTSFKDITTLQNLFVLSRLVNTKFIQLLFPAGNTDDNTGNESGSDDPSIAAFFGNQRWKSTVTNPNGELFFGGLLPAQIDGDYSQLISINSEFGTLEYSPENYGQSSIYFAVEDDDGYPYYGVFFSGDNQQRDYISPRRTLYNPIATLPLTSADTTNILVRTQVVPFYQWRTNQSKGDPTPTIFANQNNNFNSNSTTYFSSGYQSLDRLNAASQYYNPNGNNSSNYKGYIYNIDIATGEFEVNSPSNYRTNYTFGAPFHFYFGLIQGASAMDRFITKYVDTNFVNE